MRAPRSAFRPCRSTRRSKSRLFSISSETTIKVELAGSIDAIDEGVWNACAGDGDPFLRHGFFRALERSGSAAADAGWRPLHMVVEHEGEIVAVAPTYGKGHSWGEYVFDQGWADAFERAGGSYYPKLLTAVPFTPTPGRRLLTRPDRPELAHALALGGMGAVADLGWSSHHVTFCAADEAAILKEHGYLRRMGLQYHWRNRGYRDFDDFLGALKSQKRKTIAKERRKANDGGVTIEILHGDSLEPAHMRAFYPFYRATTDKRWGAAYLTQAFFEELGDHFADKVVLVLASRDGEPVAGALNLLGGDTLYGRLWGSLESHKFLHFECCYYRAIDFAIERGLARVEAGAQGQHKLLRGYEPVATHSAHYLAHPGLRTAVERFLAAERRAVAEEIEFCKTVLPFRQQPEIRLDD